MNKIFLLSALLLTASGTIVSDLRASAPAMTRMPNYNAYFDDYHILLGDLKTFIKNCPRGDRLGEEFKKNCMEMITNAYHSYEASVQEAKNEKDRTNDPYGAYSLGHSAITALHDLRELAEKAKVSDAFDALRKELRTKGK